MKKEEDQMIQKPGLRRVLGLTSEDVLLGARIEKKLGGSVHAKAIRSWVLWFTFAAGLLILLGIKYL